MPYQAITPEGLARKLHDEKRPPAYMSGSMKLLNGTVLIQVNGPLGSGVRDYEDIIHEYVQALDDPQCTIIVFVIDSPGGSAAGIDELSGTVYSGRGRKRQIALIKNEACSAAFQLACACDRILLTSLTSGVGGGGVIVVRQELKGDAIAWASGELKAAEVRELSPVRQKYIEDILMQHMEIQFASIRLYRPQITDAVMSELLTGRIWIGQKAIAANVADNMISTLAWYSNGDIVEL